MNNKQHDWFATLMFQPDISLEKMSDLGITPSTSTMKSRDEYKNIKSVLENSAFQDDDGNFDDKKFNAFYDAALLQYNNAAELEYLNKLGGSFEYDPFAWYAGPDKKKRDTAPLAFVNPNPNRNSYGIDGLRSLTPGAFSTREIAQDQYYYDSEKGEFSDKKPNDFVGVINSFKAPRLVLDTYDEDTTEIINGKEVVHPKGSFKLNSYGAPYYRTLRPDEEIYDKDLLHVTDIWTVDGVGFNKYDPFDADGLTTEPWKVVVKNLVRIAPFLVGGQVGLVIKGLSAAGALLEFMPSFLKAVDGIATGDAMQNDFGKKMNQLESWLGRLDNSVSDRSREKIVTFENIGNMFADVTAQLFQQKAVASLPQSRLFKNVSWMRNNARVGRALSYAYMSATSSREAYSIFKNAGANDTIAGLGMLSLMGVYYKLMSSDYFKDVLFKGTWLDEANYKRITWSVLQDFKQATENGIIKAVDSPEMAKETFNWFQRAWTKAIGTIPVEGKGFFQGALSEGVEETMEEVGIDALKGLTAGMNALGIPVTKDGSELDFGFSLEDVSTRYLTSFFGGAFGGAVFHGYNLADPNYRKQLQTARQLAETPDGRIAELVNLAAEGRLEDAYRYATKLYEKGLVGNDSLAGTLFESIDSPDGMIEVAESSDKTMSQNELVYNEFVKQLRFIETVLSDEGFMDARDKISKEMGLDKNSAGIALFESLGVDNIIQRDLNRLGTNILKTRAKMQAIADSLRPKDENYDKAEYDKAVKNNAEYKDLEKELKELRKQAEAIFNKENLSGYITTAVTARNKSILQALEGFADIDDYTLVKYKKHFSEFNKAQQENIQRDYEAYKNGENKSLFDVSEVYRAISEVLAEQLVELDKKLGKLSDDESINVKTYGNSYIESVVAKSKLEAKRQQLEAKEDKTEEDLTQLASLAKDLAKLDDDIKAFKDNPDLAFNQIKNKPIGYNNFTEGAKLLLDYYKTFAGKFKYGDGELNDFFYEIRRTYGNLPLRAPVEAWLEDKDVDTDNDFFRITDTSATREDFYNLLQKFYKNLWVDNDVVKATYDEIIDLLKNRAGLSNKEIGQLLYNDLPTGRIIESTNPDGTVIKTPEMISLIPRLGDSGLFNYIDALNEARRNIIYSDISELLKQFTFATEDEDLISIMQLIQEEEMKISGNLENYRFGDPLIQQKLEKAQTFLRSVFAAVAGAGNGANKIINTYRTNEGKTPLAEISSRTQGIVFKNLQMLDNRIQFIKNLNDLNSGQKLRQQRDIAANMRGKFLKLFKEKVYIEEFKKAFGVDPETIIGSFDFDKITSENFDQYEHELVDIESRLFTEIQKLELPEEELAEKLVNVFAANSAYKQRSTKLTTDPKEIVTDYDLLVYAASVLSLHSGAWTYKYKTTVERLQEIGKNKIVPVFGQEHALRIIYSYLHNPTLFNELNKAISRTYHEEDKEIINRVILNNMISVFGGAGSGKTEGVGLFVSELFDKCEFRFIGPRDTQVKKLLKVFDKKDQTDGKTFQQFFETYAPKYLTKENFKWDKDLHKVVAIDDTIDYADWFGTENDIVRILVVDEAAKLNSLQLEAISRYAKHFGAFVITLGDTKQTTGSITYQDGTTKDADGKEQPVWKTALDGFEDTYGIRLPHLKASFRAENRAKVDNYDKLDARLDAVEDKIQNSETEIVSSRRDELVEDTKTVLHYLVADDHLAGDIITTDENYFKNLLDRLIDKGVSNILVVTDSESIKKYNDPKYDGKVTFQDAESAQGGEFSYVFVDKTVSDSKYDSLKDLYTMSQRGTLASVILDKNDFYKNKLSIETIPRRDADLPYTISDDERDAFVKWRLKSLEKIEKPENYEEFIKIGLNTAIIPTITQKPKPEPIVPAKPEQKPVEKPVTESKPVTQTPVNPQKFEEAPAIPVPEEYGKPEEVPEEKPLEKTDDLVPTEPKPSIPLKQPKLPAKIPFVRKEETVTELVADTLMEEPEENASPNTWVGSEEFYNLIFGDGFIDLFDAERNDVNSLWNFAKKNKIELKQEAYRDIMFQLHNGVMNNKDIRSIISNARFKMPTDKERLLKKLLLDKNLVYTLWNVNVGGNSNINIVITHMTDTNVRYSLNIGTLKGTNLPTGRFAEGNIFKKLSKPRYKRNEDIFITIGQLRAKYPWLQIPDFGGIPIAPENVKETNVFNEKTKAYLITNDGHTQAFAYDTADVDLDQLLRQYTLPDETLYLHNQPYDVTAFGIEKLVEPKTIAEYTACIYWLANNGYDANRTEKTATIHAALIKLGIIAPDTKDITEKVCSYLKDLTGDVKWDMLPGLFATKDDTRYNVLRELVKNNTIVSTNQINRIVMDLFNEILLDEGKTTSANLNNLYYEFTKKKYGQGDNSRRASIILTVGENSFIIKSTPRGENTWSLGLFKYDKATNMVGEEIGESQNITISNFYRVLNKAVDSLIAAFDTMTRDDFNSSNVEFLLAEESIKDGQLQGYFPRIQEQALYALFGYSFITSDNYEILLNPAKFKYGIYGSIKKNTTSTGGEMAKYNLSDDYVTNAITWTPSVFTVVGTIIEGQVSDPETANRTILYNQMNSWLAELKQSETEILQSNPELINTLENTIKNDKTLDDNTLEIYFNRFLDEINNILLENVLSLKVNQYHIEDGSLIKTTLNDNTVKARAYSNIITKNFSDVDINSVNEIVYPNEELGGPSTQLDVVRNGNRTFVIFENADGNLTIKETKAYDAWEGAMKTVISLGKEQNAVTYLNHLLNDSIDDIIVQNYIDTVVNAVDARFSQISDKINTYLEKRLIDNEC